MPNLRVFSGRELRLLLAEHGFVEVRQRGSHVVMQKFVAGGTVTVPVPDYREIRVGTLMSIIRQTGLERRLFEVQ